MKKQLPVLFVGFTFVIFTFWVMGAVLYPPTGGGGSSVGFLYSNVSPGFNIQITTNSPQNGTWTVATSNNPTFGSTTVTNNLTNNVNGVALPDVHVISGTTLEFDNASGYQSAIAGSGGALAGLYFKVTNNAGAEIIMEGIASTGIGFGPVTYHTNGIQVLGGSPGILASNTLGAGASYGQITTNAVIFLTNAEAGVSTIVGTNGFLYVSNAIKGGFFQLSSTNFVYSNSIAYLTITNGHIAITNYGAAGQRVDIDPSVNGSVLWGDNNQTNYESIGVAGVVVSNAVGFQLFSSDSQVQSNRLTGNVIVGTNGTYSFSGGIQSTSGSLFLSLNTNAAGHAQQTNALTWSTIQATNEFTFWAFATNLTVSGYQNVENAHMYHGWLCLSNGAAASVTVTPPTGTRILATLTTNQPNNTITVTNGKINMIEWFLNSHLGQNITTWVVFNQQN